MGPKRGAEVRQLEEDMVQVNVLGAAKEVGRSCVIVRYKGLTIMLDCGIHPGRTGENSLPYFDNGPEASEVDLILISHFHLDHAASLPYFTEKVGGGSFKGRIFATHPTKAIMRLMIQNHIRSDSVRVAGEEAEETLYTEADMQACLDKIEVVDFHQVVEVKGIKFRCYNAGHVLGAAMFLIEIDNIKILYTGDYSMEDDRHLMAAEVPNRYNSPDILIVESTYGVQNHPPKEEREKRFVDEVSKIIRRGGRCLLPVFALGRAQELMLILDEYWAGHRDLQKVPIYYASYTSDKAHRVYETYVNMMNAHVRQQMDLANPFRFQFVHNLKSVQDVDDFLPSVVLASPGFLNSGHSRQLFDRWCTNEKNGVVMTGYTTEGTLSRTLLTHPETVEDMRGNVQPLRCSVEAISFSAHVDYRQNEGFMKAVKPAIVVLVHGEQNQMAELKKALIRTMQQEGSGGPSIITPDLCTDVRLAVPKRKAARLIGAIARKAQEQRKANAQAREGREDGGEGEELEEEEGVTAVVVSRNFTSRLVDPEDLAHYTQLRRAHLLQRVHFPFHHTATTLRCFLDELFDDVMVEGQEGDMEGVQHTEGEEEEEEQEEEEEEQEEGGKQDEEEGGQKDVEPAKQEAEGGAAEDGAEGEAGAEEAHKEASKDEGEGEDGHPAAHPPQEEEEPLSTTFIINQAVRVCVDRGAGKATVEWEAGPMSDMVADATIALAMEAQCSPVTLRMTSTPCCAHRRLPRTATHAHEHHHTEGGAPVATGELAAQVSEAAPPQEDAPQDTDAEGTAAPMDVVAEEEPQPDQGGDTGVEESKVSVAQDGEAPPDAATAAEEGVPTPAEAPSTEEGGAAAGGEAGGPKPESQLRTRVKMLHRVLAAIYGAEHVKADMTIYELHVSVAGGVGGEGKVNFNGDEVLVSSDDPSMYEQLSTVVNRVWAALYDQDPGGYDASYDEQQEEWQGEG